MKKYKIIHSVTPEARKAIFNALRQYKFFRRAVAYGPAYNPNERETNKKNFKEYHPPFLLNTRVGAVEVSPEYKETKTEIKYNLNVYENDKKIEEPIKYLKHLLK